ncbi:MAG: sugar ABC transporter permease [Deinococcales bacterium]
MNFLGEMKRASELKPKWRLSKIERIEAFWGYSFISLWLIGFLLFYLLPMTASLIFSFYDFNLSTPEEAHFVGLANWKRLLFQDPIVWQSLGVTFKFALISLPIGMISALFLALLLNSKNLLAPNIFRTLFYAPAMVPAVAGILIWTGVLNPTTGWLNRLIEAITGADVAGPNGIRWLDDPWLVYIAYTLIGLWGIGNAILYNLASLQGVPSELYEAAKIDGASYWRRLISITFPMISPVIFYNLILGTIGLLQYFITPWVLNGGSGYPDNSTRFYMIWFYKQSFTFQNMGYGSTLAWFMFIIALVITLLLFTTSNRWVYYAGVMGELLHQRHLETKIALGRAQQDIVIAAPHLP